ncbi:Uncharacterised protein [Klebsiella pneumoniae]|nr:Uncharacterised protein [Klebsiella pneumoniae]SYP97796.1 Uncharacterised protein [Klebsiella pneumoniae]
MVSVPLFVTGMMSQPIINVKSLNMHWLIS